nr:retrotransposon protein, putative, Ty1-copia subclass [Tanacetum cinerariifolium]
MAAKGNQGKGKTKLAYAPERKPTYTPKPKIPPPPKKDNPVKDAICHQCGEVGHWRRNCPVYLAEVLKKKKLSQRASTLGIFTIELYYFSSTFWVYDTDCDTHICITTQGLMGSRKLEPGALSLYVGDGHRATIEAIREYHLCLPSGLVLILHNCHYAPSITREIISVSRLYDDGFIIRFDDNILLVSRNNLVYFCAIPRDGIYQIDLSSSNTNDSYMRNKTLLDMVRFMMIKTTLSKSFWDYAIKSVACILNIVLTKKVEKTPYEVWHEQAPKLSYLKVLGCEALVKRDTLTKFDKLGPIYIKCIFVGYPKETMGYSFYYPLKNKVFVAQNAEFFKNSLITQEASGSLEDLEIIKEEDTQHSTDTSLHHDEDGQQIDEPQSDINPISRSTRTCRAPDRMCLQVDAGEHELWDLGEPANYKAALLDPESNKWLDAMNVEMQSMKDNKVWDLVNLPPNGKTVGSKWLFKKNTVMDGAIHTFKARLVAKGFTQTYEVDYEQTFSPVAGIRTIRILIAITAFYDYEIWKMAIKTAFLNGHLSEEVYMDPGELHFTTVKNILKYLRNTKEISFRDSEISELKYELEKLKKEKESTQLKIEIFDSASKSLDKLIESQISDISKKGLGYESYHAVPPPPTRLFSPPKIDLSYSRLEEFQQPEFEIYGPKSCKIEPKNASENIPIELKEFTEVKESFDVPLVKKLVSDDKLKKKTFVSDAAKIEFCKAKQQEKPVRKPVEYAEMYKSQGPRGNQRN